MSYTEDDAKWDVYIADHAYDLLLKEIKENNEIEKYQAFRKHILNGYKKSELLLATILKEISGLDKSKNCQSMIVMYGCLLEICERDVLGIPYLISILSLSEEEDERFQSLRRIQTQGISIEFEAIGYLKDEKSKKIAKDEQDKIFKSASLTIKKDLQQYRAFLKNERNEAAHGRAIKKIEDVELFIKLTNSWREFVFNPILKEF